MSADPGRRLLALDLPPGGAFVRELEVAWERGDAVLPLDPHAPHSAKRQVLAAMRPHAVVTTSGETRYADPAPLEPDVALVITTSGSTGEPKGAQLSHAALEASAAATADRIGSDPADVWLSCLPWQHIGGLQVLLRARRSRLPLTILSRFDVDRVADEIRAGATLTSLVPTTLQRLLDAEVDLARLRVILLGGAAASSSLLTAAGKAGAPVVTTYGMSETCGGVVYDGRPLDGIEVRIADDGRIEIRGATLMSGYRLRPELDPEVLQDGWLRTNDLGDLDHDGRLVVHGRADDVINTGGEKVVAGSVAQRVAGHPAVEDVVVVGVPDDEWGERVVAVVQLRPGAVAGSPARGLELAGLRDWLSDQLPLWALPRGLLVVVALPRLASGKPDRLACTRWAAGQLGG